MVARGGEGHLRAAESRRYAPRVEVRDRENDADLARTLVHDYAHALLHFDVDDDMERSKREVEAEAVGRYCGLDTSGSAFYLAAWEAEGPEVVRERLGRISITAEEIIDMIDHSTRSYVELRKDPITRQSMAEPIDSPARWKDRMMPNV